MSESKTILITGATAGIGRHAALHLARRGHRVIATGRGESALDKLRAEATASGASLETLRLDVTDAASVAGAAAKVDALTQGRGLDALVNNAGYGLGGPLEEVSLEDLRAQFETNVFGLMAVTKAFLPKMRERGAGRVVNVASIGGRITFPFMGAYHASKYAVEALSDALRRELRAFGVQVVLIEPGPIKTEFSDRAMGTIARTKAGSASSPYASVYAQAERFQAISDANAVGPECVTRAIERAITARRPAARYAMPWKASFVTELLLKLPTRWADALMVKMMGLRPPERSTAAASGTAAGR